MVDVARLKVDGAIFHQVPRRGSTAGSEDRAPAVVLSTVESMLDDRLEFFLRDRLAASMRESAQPILEDPDIESPLPALVRDTLQHANADIVEPFQPAAEFLYEAQAPNSPEGLFAVVRGRVGPEPVLALLKVEQERGLSFETIIEGDEVRIEVGIEEGLVLTSKTEVFKAALFWLEQSDDGATSLQGLVTDDQSGSLYRGPASQFWIYDFLGCRYARESDVMTRSWIRAMERAIRSDIEDAGDKSTALAALHAELGSNRSAISPKKFIADFVPADSQDAATQRLRDAGAPTTSFTKSREVSSRAPTKKTFEFVNGVRVVVPSEVEPDLSKERVDGDEVDVLTVKGTIRRVV